MEMRRQTSNSARQSYSESTRNVQTRMKLPVKIDFDLSEGYLERAMILLIICQYRSRGCRPGNPVVGYQENIDFTYRDLSIIIVAYISDTSKPHRA